MVKPNGGQKYATLQSLPQKEAYFYLQQQQKFVFFFSILVVISERRVKRRQFIYLLLFSTYCSCNIDEAPELNPEIFHIHIHCYFICRHIDKRFLPSNTEYWRAHFDSQFNTQCV